MDVRTKILEVSLKLFNEFESENISTNEIAKKTDISTGTLYYYFKNKEEMIVELFIKMNKEYDDKFNKQIDFVRGFNRDIILIDDSDFLEEYSFFSKEANILIKNDENFRKLNNEVMEKREKYLYMIFKLLQNQEILVADIKEEVIEKIIKIIYFNGAYNPLLRSLDGKETKESIEIKKLLPFYGFLTEKGKEFFRVEDILGKTED